MLARLVVPIAIASPAFASPLPTCDITPTATIERHFGSKHAGFIEWVGATGRLVVLDEFRTDTDRDGAITPRFSDHGLPVGDQPTVVVVDVVRKREHVVDDIVAFDPSGRYVAALQKSALVVFDDQGGGVIDLSRRGADTTPDANPALLGRQLAFGPTGIAGYFKGNVPTLIDLATGNEQALPPPRGLAWRILPSARPGWARVLEVNADSNADGKLTFPRRNSTCGIRYCNRFARATSSSGWAPDTDLFETVLASTRSRIEAPRGAEIPLDDDTWLDPAIHAVRRSDGTTIAPPAGCFDPVGFDGSDAILVECRGGSRLWWPLAGRDVALGGYVRAIDARVHDGRFVAITRSPTAWRGKATFARLALATGALDTGPEIDGAGGLARTTPDGVVLLDVAGGRVATLRGAKLDDDAVIGADGKQQVVAGCAAFPLAAGEQPVGEACALGATRPDGRLARGPWRMRCMRR